MRHGTRLGVDVGRARIGVARSDPSGLLATPVETVPRDTTRERHVAAIVAHVVETDAIEVLVGLPLSLAGGDTPSTTDARDVAAAIAEATEVPVRLVDERLTTVTAARQLRDVGRSASRSRDRIDQMAAVVLLQNALDAERSTGREPGAPVERRDEDSVGSEPKR
ncbi:Holliday junction resolvase RuvX [Pseudoclavibacter chungangensis]|uniref:Putative pre-16S rRNA nuclease n=1 Tax=Pseudoclavibacter chungangensis TaxID=587635 RepID=A0A7J5BVI9_9MICO|nr:Holliday junction resolvase RuvX [Pseudoclavibacter chungangensis]KAB1657862.1 Holliday junction resolvase RuvX [Pseudoclavibacter chungangensis]NYJ66537.1 putative Holliday junction resolvase [Pseudoclavibacter chungangensis]